MKKRKIHPALSLWILIAVALVIFISLSLADDINLGGYQLTKSYFAETLLHKNEEEMPDSIFREEADTVSFPVEIQVEPDTTVHNILIFGDSMTHNLAMAIAKYGTKNNYKVTSVTWESSSMPGWNGSGKIKKYMDMSHPDLVFISLGSNEVGLRNFDSRIKDIKNITAQVGDVPYIWVGPPLWKEDKGLYPVLEKTLPKGRLFKAENLDISRGPDKIHPTHKGAEIWADTLMRWISKSDHPILAEKPDSGTTTKGHKFIYLRPNE